MRLLPITVFVDETDAITAVRDLQRRHYTKKLDADMAGWFGIGKKASNGTKAPTKRGKGKVTQQGGETAEKFLADLIVKRPLTTEEIIAAFVKDGRSAKSVSSVLSGLKKNEVLRVDKETGHYHPGRKLRDRIRHRNNYAKQKGE